MLQARVSKMDIFLFGLSIKDVVLLLFVLFNEMNPITIELKVFLQKHIALRRLNSGTSFHIVIIKQDRNR